MQLHHLGSNILTLKNKHVCDLNALVYIKEQDGKN